MADFIKEYVDYCKEITDAPPVYHEFMALGTLAAVVGGRVYCAWGHKRIKPNLYMLFIGPSNTFRKSTALSISQRLAEHSGAHIYANDFRTECLYQQVVEQPWGTFYLGEFASLGALRSGKITNSRDFLASLFDCESLYTRRIRLRPVKIREPCVSIFSAARLDRFVSHVTEDDLAGGFLSRFVFVPAYEKTHFIEFPPPEDREQFRHLSERLQETGDVRGEAVFEPQAREIYSRWVRSHRQLVSNPLLSSLVTTLETCAIKFAILQNVADNLSLNITAESARDACRRVDFLTACLQSLEPRFAFTREHRSQNRILKWLLRHGTSSHAKLLRNTHLSSAQFNSAIVALIESQLVKVSGIKTGRSTRPARIYSLMEPEENRARK